MIVNFDNDREKLTNIEEVILAEPKSRNDFEIVILESLKTKNSVLITRMKKKHKKKLDELHLKNQYNIEIDNYGRTAIIRKDNIEVSKVAKVAILSGGTSDQYVVEEIIFCLKYFGINALTFPDIGVAGIHRHKDALAKIENNANIKLLIVVAGNEGALFSVISSQTKLPMIAVPTNIGYGYGGKGETALKSALQSCSPGVVAVNIDNGFGAAAFAKKLFSF
ncbi:MAG: nickel pincer cofactor biosynthesis protein LarB [Candidatus Kariarchaeum pelagius]